MKNLNVFIAKGKLNNKNKIFDKSTINKISKININNSNYICNKQNFNSFSSQIKEEPKSEKKNSINFRRNNLIKFMLPKLLIIQY